MVILRGARIGIVTHLLVALHGTIRRSIWCPLVGIVLDSAFKLKIIFRSKFIVVVVLAPAVDHGKRVSSKILPRL